MVAPRPVEGKAFRIKFGGKMNDARAKKVHLRTP
jgi:hypothetical protein